MVINRVIALAIVVCVALWMVAPRSQPHTTHTTAIAVHTTNVVCGKSQCSQHTDCPVPVRPLEKAPSLREKKPSGDVLADVPTMDTLLPLESSPRQHVIIVGAAGYVGSALLRDLGMVHNITGYDRNPRAMHFPSVTRGHARDIPQSLLDRADAVVYLGGVSSPATCDSNPSCEKLTEENVDELVTFVKRMHSAQTIFFASTSAIGEGSGDESFSETDEPKTHLFDAHTRSMYQRERAVAALARDRAESLPRLVAMRFGTIIGISPSQRTEPVHVAMVRSALLDGRITARHPETARSFLALRDLSAAVNAMLRRPSAVLPLELNVFHLVSFSGTIGHAANEVAAAVGVPVTFIDHDGPDVVGCTLSTQKFEATFEFKFRVSEPQAIQELLTNATHVKLGRELTDRPHPLPIERQPHCRVCGSPDMHLILDFGAQPLRPNSFHATLEEAVEHTRHHHPLRLHRCRKCHHAQLSVNGNNQQLLNESNHLGASRATDDDHVLWLGGRVDEDAREMRNHTGTHKHNGTVPGLRILEIARNGSALLDELKRRGWEVYGVEPAIQLGEHARATVATGPWSMRAGLRFAGLPKEVDAIVAPNVLAYVPDPNSFMAAIVDMMHEKTLAYLLTPHCAMFHERSELETMSHEHVSFFSTNSFRVLAERHALRIVKYEIAPIDGGSCFVTLAKASSAVAGDRSLQNALALDKERGLTDDAFYIDYRSRVQATYRWTAAMLDSAATQGIRIVGYGAGSKGMMLLLNALKSKPHVKFDYVVDDEAPSAHEWANHYPGTRIPIKPTAELGMQNCESDVMIVVFTRGLWPDIRRRISLAMRDNAHRCSRSSVWVIVPASPVHRLVLLELQTEKETEVLANPFQQPSLPLHTQNPGRPRALLVTHFYNEALLLPYFINNHAPMFDKVILIDCGSTDNSVEIIRRLAPSSWEVVPSKYKNVFHHQLIDDEVVEWENRFPGWWKISLTTTEFLVHRDWRGFIDRLEGGRPYAVAMPAVRVVGEDDVPLKRFAQLMVQRNSYSFVCGTKRSRDGKPAKMTKDYKIIYSRFVHNVGDEFSARYPSGRHEFRANATLGIHPSPALSAEGLIAKFAFSPWPESITRKLQIGARIPAEHIRQGYGSYHQTTGASLNSTRNWLRGGVVDMNVSFAACTHPGMQQVHSAWYAATAGPVSIQRHCPIDPDCARRVRQGFVGSIIWNLKKKLAGG